MTNNIIHSVWKSEALRGRQLGASLDLFYERMPTWPPGQPKLAAYRLEEILDQALARGDIDWVVVHGEGQIYRSQIRILELIETFIQTLPSDTLVAGQLIDKPGYYCGIHEQFLIVNLNTYQKLGKPFFGDYEDRTLRLHNYRTGPDLHDGYTPQFIEPVSGEQERRTWTCGWNFVDASMREGLKIPNIPEDIRREKVFIYPSEETERLLQNHEALYSIQPTGNISQNRALAYLMLKKLGIDDYAVPGIFASYRPRKTVVFAFNTEALVPDPHWIRENPGPLSYFIGTCAGFLDVANLKHFGMTESTRLIYYDVNPDSILYKKYLLEHFDGNLKGILDFLSDFKKRHPDVLLADNSVVKGFEDLRKEFSSEEEFTALWGRMRRLPREFIRLNLITGGHQKLDRLLEENKRALFCISDIFTGMNELTYGTYNLNKIFRNMLKDLGRFPGLIIQGKDPGDEFILDYAAELDRRYSHV